MRHLSYPIMLAAGLSLVALQLSGLHLHVNADGYAGAPQGTHVHGQGVDTRGTGTHLAGADDRHEHPDDQDHEGDKDMSVVELSTGASKLLVFLIWLGLGLFTVLRPADRISPNAAVPRLIVRNIRWRPPLRAPPQFSYSPSH
jgi:hypothetical protein